MTEPENPADLAPRGVDHLVAALKAVSGLAPHVGSFVAELVGIIIPNQRIDRLTKFVITLGEKLTRTDHAVLRAQLSNENFTDLLEEGVHQATRAVTDERRAYIASVIAQSVASQDIEYLESKHLLRILGDINDIEVIWLRFYANQTHGEDGEYREMHHEVLSPIGAHMGSTQQELDKETLQESYKAHLSQLGLLAPRYRINRATGALEIDTYSGNLKIQTYTLTRLGRLLLRHLDLTADENDNADRDE
jgi:hypothetical protein